MKKITGKTAIAALFCAMFLSSCNTPLNTVENADKHWDKEFIRNKRMEADEYLAKRLQIDSVDMQEMPGGLMKVQVAIRNQKRSDDKFAYRFQWFNASGMQIVTSAQPWLEKTIIGGEIVYLSAVAPNPQCKDFKIQLREIE